MEIARCPRGQLFDTRKTRRSGTNSAIHSDKYPYPSRAETRPEAKPEEAQEMRVAIYARVSTLHGQDPEMQLGELREGVQPH